MLLIKSAHERIAVLLREMEERLADNSAIELPMSGLDIADHVGPWFSPIHYVSNQSGVGAHGASRINAGRAGPRRGWLRPTAPLRSRRD